jgi:hypothetical protein
MKLIAVDLPMPRSPDEGQIMVEPIQECCGSQHRVAMLFDLTAQRPRALAIQKCRDFAQRLLGDFQARTLRIPKRGRIDVLPVADSVGIELGARSTPSAVSA